MEGEKYGKFEEDIEASKTYGTMGAENGIGPGNMAGAPYQADGMGQDNPGFQESSFTEYPNQQKVIKIQFDRRSILHILQHVR